MYMKLIGGILWNELLVWMRNGRRENPLGLEFVKNKNKVSPKTPKKDDLSLFNRDLNRGCLVYMFSLRSSGSKFLINLRRQFRARKIFSST